MTMAIRAAASLLMVATAGCVGTHQAVRGSDSLFQSADAQLSRSLPGLVEFRHDLHQYPEVSGEEIRTSRMVAQRLEELGWDVRTGVGGHGVVGVLKGSKEGPVVAFRADMDAVFSDAPDPVAYASLVNGVRHICGHDVHTAIGVGLAETLASIQDQMQGTAVLVFQPAEEAGTGAEAMLADGLFDDMKPDAILSLHTAPLTVGTLSAMPNGMMAGRLKVDVALSGSGDLAAAVDSYRQGLIGIATVEGAALMQPASPDFVAVTLFGDEPVAGKSTAQVSGFVMTAGLDRRELIKNTVKAALDEIIVDQIEAKVSFTQSLEGVNNDANILEVATRGIGKRAPDVTVAPMTRVYPLFSEDFGSLQKNVPGVMFFIGVNNPEKGTVGLPHQPDYVADDAAIAVGVRAMLAAMLELME